MIHEPPQRNLGIVTGRYLEKAVHMNQVTGELFKPSDFYPGAIVKVYNREFEIMDMDEYTRKYVETGDVARKFDLGAVVEKLRESMRQQYPLVRDIFRKFDTDHDGVLTAKEFKEALAKFGFQCSPDEINVIMKHFDARVDGQVSYNEFCDVLLDEDYTTSMMKHKPPLDQTRDHHYAGKASLRMQERAETEKVRAAARAIGDVVYKHTQTFFKLFKEFATMTHEGRVNYRQIQEALLQIGFEFELEDVKRTVLFVLPNADLGNIDYVKFLKAMNTSYHDLCHNR
jgi:Ca2+-binding EF-hand superfamily protein